MTNHSHLETASVLTTITASLAGVGGIGWRARKRRRRKVAEQARALEEFLGDWHGRPARPGIPAQQGVMQRLADNDARLTRIEHELHPNSGSSLRDAVDRLEARHRP